VSSTPEYLKGTVEVEVLESHNKALRRRALRDKALAVEVSEALQKKDWLTKLKRVWQHGQTGSDK
jgi:hypothetical protein